jgi:hypothetical protein
MAIALARSVVLIADWVYSALTLVLITDIFFS